MKLLLVLLLLGGCADGQTGQPGSVHAHVNGVYTTFVGVGASH